MKTTMRGEAESRLKMEARASKMVEETETESSGSSKTLIRRWIPAKVTATKAKDRVYNQVSKIREEDLCVLIEDRVANPEDGRYLHLRGLNLPCSPLRPVNAVQ